MFPIKVKDNKFYIGIKEVEAEPVYLGFEIEVNFEGKVPPLETVIFDFICDLKNEKIIDLFDKANAYRFFLIGAKDVPPEKVPDGLVPGSGMRNMVFDFYKIRPKSSEQK